MIMRRDRALGSAGLPCNEQRRPTPGSERLIRRCSDPVAVMVHGLALLTSMASYAVLPLLPIIRRDFGLSPTGLSILLALPSLAMIAFAMPTGWLCDRWGPRRVTLVAAILFTVSCGLQADPRLIPFALGRLLFGVSLTAIWTSGPAWLQQSRPGSSGRVGAIVTSAAAGTIAGPVVAGLLADRFGFSSPYAVFGLAGLLAIAPFGFCQRGHRPVGRSTPARWGSLAAQAAHSRQVCPALAAMVTVGAASGAVQLLVPLQLSRAGESVATIGVALSVAGLLYVSVSAVMARAGAATVTTGAVVLGCGLMAVLIAPAGISTESVWVIVCLLGFTIPRAQLNTVSYRLAATSDLADSGNLGALVGMLNLVWAISMTFGPIGAAWLYKGIGMGAAFLGTASWAAAVGLILAVPLLVRREEPIEAGVAAVGQVPKGQGL